MDIEEKQAEHIDYFVKQASNRRGSELYAVVVEATSHPSLFVFSEILSVPNIGELEGTEHSTFFNLLRMFAHGTWSEYKSVAKHLPQLVPAQVRKLKQLTVLQLAETNKVLPYDTLMKELDVTSVRELEDFLIDHCTYAVEIAAVRDLRPGQMDTMIQTLDTWQSTSENLLESIEDKIKWADSMSEIDKKHQKEVDERVEEMKKTLSLKCTNYKQDDDESRVHEEVSFDEDGVMGFGEGRRRSKRKRRVP